MTWEECQNICTIGSNKTDSSFYRYFAITEGDTCVCGDTYTHPVTIVANTTQCEQNLCPGSGGSQYCGGDNRLVLWEVDGWSPKVRPLSDFVICVKWLCSANCSCVFTSGKYGCASAQTTTWKDGVMDGLWAGGLWTRHLWHTCDISAPLGHIGTTWTHRHNDATSTLFQNKLVQYGSNDTPHNTIYTTRYTEEDSNT